MYAALSAILAASAGYLINLVSNGPTWPLIGGAAVLVAALAILEYRRATAAGPAAPPPPPPGDLEILLDVDRAEGEVTMLETHTPPPGNVTADAKMRFLGPLARFTGVRIHRDPHDRDPHDRDPHDRDPHDRDPHDRDPG